MQVSKKRIRIILGIGGVILLLLAAVLSVPLVNDRTCAKITERLEDIPLPEDTAYLESVTKAGKLVGNGNGMQYFGTILIKSQSAAEELSAYYAQYDANIEVRAQTSQTIDWLEHAPIALETAIEERASYYLVSLWGEGISPFAELDLRGH